LLGFLVLLIIIGTWLHQAGRARAYQDAGKTLESVAKLKVVQIVAWRKDLLTDAGVVSESPALHAILQGGFDSLDTLARAKARAWMATLRKQYSLPGLAVLDAEGKVRLSDPEGWQPQPRSAEWRERMIGALADGHPRLTPPEREPGGAAVLDALMPIQHGGARGVLVVRVDLDQSLIPLLEIWPARSQTGETLLLRSSEDHLVFISRLRHRPGAPLTQKIDLNHTVRPGVRAAKGETGLVIGRDYRDTAVLAFLAPVPGTRWSLVAKMDLTEVDEPLHSQKLILLAAGLVLTLAAAGAAWAFLLRQRAEFFRRQFEDQSTRRALAEHYGNLVRLANDAILLMDKDGKIVEANERAEEIYGYSRKELLARSIRDLRIPEPEEQFENLQKRIAERGDQGLMFRAIHRRRDSAEFPVEVSARSFQTDDQPYYQSVIRDITDRTRAELRANQLSRLYQVLLKIGHAVVLAADRESLFREVCQIAVTQGGFTLAWIGIVDSESLAFRPAAWSGRLPEAAFRGDVTVRDDPSGHGTMGEAYRKGRVVVANDCTSDPRMLPWRADLAAAGHRAAASVPLRIGGRIQGVFQLMAASEGLFGPEEVSLLEQVAEDLSHALDRLEHDRQLREAVAALRSSDERFRIAVDSTALSLLETDLDMRVTWAYNPSLHLRVEEMTGKTPDEVIAPQEAAKMIGPMQQVLATGTGMRQEMMLAHLGEQRWFDVVVEPRVDVTGQTTGLLLGAWDITDRTHLQEALVRSQKLEAIGRLAGGVAHDMNNLLTIINGYSRLLLRRLPEGDSMRRAVGEILDAGSRGENLTRQLLAFSRRQKTQLELVDVTSIVAGMESMLRRLIGADVVLETNLSADAGLVRADRGQIEQVVMNLAVNARDAMPDGGTLSIETSFVTVTEDDNPGGLADGEYLRLSVADSGCGMDEVTRCRIFEPFFTTKEEGKGTGLGLAIVYGIARQSGGDVTVNSSPGRGSTFTIYLPRAESPAASEAPKSSPASTRAHPRTILLVDDENGVREVARMALEEAGHRVLPAATGA
jgi:PAS domain S-box-containing protein